VNPIREATISRKKHCERAFPDCEVASDQPRSRNGSTTNGDGQAKLLAGTYAASQYENGSCLNLEPIGQ